MNRYILGVIFTLIYSNALANGGQFFLVVYGWITTIIILLIIMVVSKIKFKYTLLIFLLYFLFLTTLNFMPNIFYNIVCFSEYGYLNGYCALFWRAIFPFLNYIFILLWYKKSKGL